MTHKERAEEALRALRDGKGFICTRIANLFYALRDAQLSLADIGTSEAEIAELTMKGHKPAAEQWLALLRGMHGVSSKTFLVYLLEEVRLGQLSFADIGTTKAEMRQLRVGAYKAVAKFFLNELRKSPHDKRTHLQRVREEVEEGGFTLADIGTSETELAAFVPNQT